MPLCPLEVADADPPARPRRSQLRRPCRRSRPPHPVAHPRMDQSARGRPRPHADRPVRLARRQHPVPRQFDSRTPAAGVPAAVGRRRAPGDPGQRHGADRHRRPRRRAAGDAADPRRHRQAATVRDADRGHGPCRRGALLHQAPADGGREQEAARPAAGPARTIRPVGSAVGLCDDAGLCCRSRTRRTRHRRRQRRWLPVAGAARRAAGEHSGGAGRTRRRGRQPAAGAQHRHRPGHPDARRLRRHRRPRPRAARLGGQHRRRQRRCLSAAGHHRRRQRRADPRRGDPRAAAGARRHGGTDQRRHPRLYRRGRRPAAAHRRSRHRRAAGDLAAAAAIGAADQFETRLGRYQCRRHRAAPHARAADHRLWHRRVGAGAVAGCGVGRGGDTAHRRRGGGRLAAMAASPRRRCRRARRPRL